MKMLENTYFEKHAEEFLRNAGLTKAKFADAMGVARQNVIKLFETKNVITLSKAASVLGVPLDTLIHGHMSERKIDGFIEIDGNKVYRIRSREDIEKLLTETTQDKQENHNEQQPL